VRRCRRSAVNGPSGRSTRCACHASRDRRRAGFTLWRTMTKERTFSGERMSRVGVFRMVKRRLRDAGLPEAANCDSIRTAGIASYLANGGAFGRAGRRAHS
jgi:hypothetical protein